MLYISDLGNKRAISPMTGRAHRTFSSSTTVAMLSIRRSLTVFERVSWSVIPSISTAHWWSSTLTIGTISMRHASSVERSTTFFWTSSTTNWSDDCRIRRAPTVVANTGFDYCLGISAIRVNVSFAISLDSQACSQLFINAEWGVAILFVNASQVEWTFP